MGKHKKHKSDRRERFESPVDGNKPAGLKLILKVGSQATPEHNTEWGYSGGTSYNVSEDGSCYQPDGAGYFGSHRSHHKKSKKKKKKKDKNKDREKRHRHHHKEKKHKRIESSQDEGSIDEASLSGICVGSPLTREPRMCVLRQRQEKSPLQRALEQVLRLLEKKDPQQFFAWPVTDAIAPGYSAIITSPMDFSTMRQKIDEGLYANMQDFIADFKLMCTNAMQYNHADTVYYKASKKLLHAGLKCMMPDKLGWLLSLIPELGSKELGFEITAELRHKHRTAGGDAEEPDDDVGIGGIPDAKRHMPASRFEAIHDEMGPEEILRQAQIAAQNAKAKLSLKRSGAKMGFLRQTKDGTTFLNILVANDGTIPGTKKRPVSLGALTGKLPEGTSQMQGFREDKRNISKPVKPLYYGAFGSYAPSYDSAFANLTKEESDLVYQTYGSDVAVQYAESILDFAKDCDYTLHMVDSLLDLLTGGDHSRTKTILEEKKMLREEEDAIKTILESATPPVQPPAGGVSAPNKVDVSELKSLGQLGINMDFLEDLQEEIKSAENVTDLQQRLDSTWQLLDRLQRAQHSRLSLPLPQHLNNVPSPSEEEQMLAESVSENLVGMAKRVNPADVAPAAGLRKALGVAPLDVPDCNDVADLESELRQFLEAEQTLSHSPLRDDKTIEEILMQ